MNLKMKHELVSTFVHLCSKRIITNTCSKAIKTKVINWKKASRRSVWCGNRTRALKYLRMRIARHLRWIVTAATSMVKMGMMSLGKPLLPAEREKENERERGNTLIYIFASIQLQCKIRSLMQTQIHTYIHACIHTYIHTHRSRDVCSRGHDDIVAIHYSNAHVHNTYINWRSWTQKGLLHGWKW